jgi:hypothetical protein
MSGSRSGAVGTSGSASAPQSSTAQDPNNPNAQTNTANRSGRRNLPGTASQLPLMMLLAFGALAAAGAMRVIRASVN